MESPEVLARRARRRYELGRLRRSVFRLWPLVPIGALAALLGNIATTAVLATLLAVVSAALLFVGRGFDRAVAPGWRAGVVPTVAALAMWQAQGCTGPCPPLCVPLCSVAGLVVGAWLGTTMLRHERPVVVLASLGVAGLTASLGCAPLGLATVAGAVAGIAAGMLPRLAWRSPTAG